MPNRLQFLGWRVSAEPFPGVHSPFFWNQDCYEHPAKTACRRAGPGGARRPASPARAPAASQAALPKLEFEKYTLPNGLQVILHVDRKLPIVHVNQWFHVGSKNEKTGRTGFAHLFEHMMFQGSKNASGEYFVYAEKAGANLREGGVNGTTSNDRTNYFATVPSANLENLLWVESDRLATLLDATTTGEARRAARRREERAAAGPREPALRPMVHVAVRNGLSDNGHPIRGR